MSRINRKNIISLLALAVLAVLVCGVIFLAPALMTNRPIVVPVEQTVAPTSESIQEPVTQPTESYKGQDTRVADSFSIKVPNGWTASISNSPSFLAIMFARPNQLNSLVYNPDALPAIDQLGIPAWSGLTEHFFVIVPTLSQQFNQDDHLEVSSEPFTFDDGFVGEKYYVVKHASEAQKWGGLQKDTEWQGRTYIYEKDGKRVEAHLAVYPSSNIDINFYESVVRTLRL